MLAGGDGPRAGRSPEVESAMPSREEGHLIVAAIRLLQHREGRSPRPEELAELLEWPAAALRVHLVALQKEGVVALVESAFDTHVEIRDHLRLEELATAAEATDLETELANFDRRKQEETERMGRLFSEGEPARRQAERLQKMDKELQDFRKRKPRDPFAKE
jgi:hypothetical protein